MRKIGIFLLALCVACVTAVAGASSASAIDPRYRAYAGCPDRPEIFSCLRADTPAGNIRLGNQNVPINQTQTLSGGSVVPTDTTLTLQYNSLGGLQGAPLEVPGGLAGLTGISEIILNLITFGANRVYSDAEVVGQPVLTVGTFSLSMNIQVKLINPFLRSGCSIGTTSNPIRLNLIAGTTAPPPPARPISGHPPVSVDFDPTDDNIFLARDIKQVDNSFSAPGASGCDLFGFGLINGLVNSRVGLPSAAGRNEAVFDRTDLRIVQRSLVYP